MAAKKDAPAEDVADEEAGLVPKGETVDAPDVDEVPADEVTVDIPADEPPATSPDDIGPPPSTPSSSTEVHQARVLFEDEVNSQAEQFASLARSEYIRAALGGWPISIVVDDGLD